MWADYIAALKGGKSEESDVEEGVIESTILYISRHDALLMTVFKCLACEEARGGQRKNVCGDISRVSIYLNGSDNAINIQVCGVMGAR